MLGLNFLRCLGRALVNKGVKGLIQEVPFGNLIYEVAADVLRQMRGEGESGNLRSEIEAVAAQDPTQAKAVAIAITQEVAADQPPEVRSALEGYLAQVSASVRRSLMRPEDPSGKSVPASMSLDRVEELLPILPMHVSKFRKGDRPECLRGEWELVDLLGVGGFGEVWKARHVDFDGTVAAVKFCLDATAQNNLLQHEAAVLNAVMKHGRHPGIVPLLDASLRSNPAWLRYEFIEGGELTSLFTELKRLSATERVIWAVRIMTSISKTVGHFHRLTPPIVHRDLKPSNILMERTSGEQHRCRIADFGIGNVAAQRSLEQMTVGTPSLSMALTMRGAHTPLYASPQQKRGRSPDVRDDVYALGVIFHQMLVADPTAERPGGRWKQRLAAQGVSMALLDVVEICFDDEADERPKDAGEVATMIEKANESKSTPTPPKPDFSDVQSDFVDYERSVVAGTHTAWLEDHAPIRLTRWREAADQGFGVAQFFVGKSYHAGKGIGENYGEALKWYRKAADQGVAIAQNNLGTMYKNGEGVTRDMTQAVAWFRQGADGGNMHAQYNLAQAYENGDGVRQDKAACAKWYRKSGEQGYLYAQRSLAWMLENGDGIPQDDPQAIVWFRKSAAQNDAYSQYNLGWMIQNARGTTRNDVEALGWYQKAADQNYADGLFAAGWMIQQGLGCKQDDVKAVELYRKAADQGHAGAQCNIGWSYEMGRGVKVDMKESLRWYRMSAAQGFKESIAALARLEKK